MRDFKSFFTSKTIWGALIALAGVLLPMFGLSLSAEDGQIMLTIIDEMIVAFGSILAIYGRVTAKKAIG